MISPELLRLVFGSNFEPPSAEVREAAKSLRQLFIALTAEGFSEDQALRLLSSVLISNGASS